MSKFTPRENAFIEKLNRDNVDLSSLSKRLKLLIKIAEITTILITLFALFIIIKGEIPKAYHVLILISTFLVLLAQYINWKHALKIITKLKDDELPPQ